MPMGPWNGYEPVCLAQHCPVDVQGTCYYPECLGDAQDLEQETARHETLAAADLDPDWPGH